MKFDSAFYRDAEIELWTRVYAACVIALADGCTKEYTAKIACHSADLAVESLRARLKGVV